MYKLFLLLVLTILAIVPDIYASNFSVSNHSIDGYEEKIVKLQQEK